MQPHALRWAKSRDPNRESLAIYKLRDSEMTIKIKFSLLRGGRPGGTEENRPKTLFFVGNATTINF